MIDAGIGPTHLNALITTMNVPALNTVTLKRYEELVGPAIEEVARRSCCDAALLEKKLTLYVFLFTKI